MKAGFGIYNIDLAIRCLEKIKKQCGGNTKIQFGDGSPVAFVFTDEVEDSPEILQVPVVQVRLDKTARKSA